MVSTTRPHPKGFRRAGFFWFVVTLFVILVVLPCSPMSAQALWPADNALVSVDEPPDPQTTEEPETTPTATEAQEGESTSPEGPEASPAPEEDDGAQASELPDYAKGSAKEKWHRFADSVRGLVTWDLFDERVTVRAYARVQVDGTVANGDDALESVFGELGNSFSLRRFTLSADGTIDHHLRYVFGYDFGEDRSLWNAYVEGIDSGLRIFGYNLGDFRVGFFQEPFSLERVTSSYYGGFLERSLPVQTFAPGNNLGYMVHNTALKERLSWAAGFFSFGSNNEQNASNSSLSVTFRVTGLPMWRDEGRNFIHVGMAFSTRTPQSSSTQYRSRPEARSIPYFADTGDIDSSNIQLFGLEAAMVKGPLWLQTELIRSAVSSSEYGNLAFWGAYFQAGFFLTGEVRPYNREEGLFERIVPGVKYQGGIPFKKGHGGAFEVTARLSNIDLEDQGIDGGNVLDLSLGLNWYANDTSRVMLNYIRSRTEHKTGGAGKANIFLLRYSYRPMSR